MHSYVTVEFLLVCACACGFVCVCVRIRVCVLCVSVAAPILFSFRLPVCNARPIDIIL